AYARTSTDVLISQRLISQQNGVVDIAPEQYQRLRQAFLAAQSLEQVNMEARRLLSQEAAFVLAQPKDKQTMDAEQIRQKFNKVLWPKIPTTPEPTPVAPATPAAQ
ncbi:hypothetical protein JWH17_23425, partial [Desulfobulbus marinus]